MPNLSRRRARGVALFISLVLLLVLTIIGVSSVQTTSLETRMARNEYDVLLAFQAAESALRDAEVFLDTVEDTDDFTDAGVDGLWNIPDPGDDYRWEEDGVWDDGRSRVAEEIGELVTATPRYLVEHLVTVSQGENPYQISPDYPSPDDVVAIFRVTARGLGGSENAQVLLQTTYGKKIN